MNWERVDVQFCDSSGGLRDTMDAMEERERCGESNSSQKVWHAIVVLRKIAERFEDLLIQDINNSTMVSEQAETDGIVIHECKRGLGAKFQFVAKYG